VEELLAVSLSPLIAWDRDVPGEDERARACHDRLLQATTDAGWIPHRLATPAAPSIPTRQPDLPTLLKRALDPGDILSPGRYVPNAEG
jgi:4-cresol dehydrogenase (hydroxylating)